MKNITLLTMTVLSTMVFLGALEGAPSASLWSKVSNGMTKAQVGQILGTPDSVSHSKSKRRIGGTWTQGEIWIYYYSAVERDPSGRGYRRKYGNVSFKEEHWGKEMRVSAVWKPMWHSVSR
jgi:hypothetical protein